MEYIKNNYFDCTIPGKLTSEKVYDTIEQIKSELRCNSDNLIVCLKSHLYKQGVTLKSIAQRIKKVLNIDVTSSIKFVGWADSITLIYCIKDNSLKIIMGDIDSKDTYLIYTYTNQFKYIDATVKIWNELIIMK